ncbi:MAG: hypothetical protein K0S55_1301 [Clostridia bacterium]|nr:hypothetical protein [Clostridia bacterium]
MKGFDYLKKIIYKIILFLIFLIIILNLTSCIPPKNNNPPAGEESEYPDNNNGTEKPTEGENPPIEEIPPPEDPDDNEPPIDDGKPPLEEIPPPVDPYPEDDAEVKPLPNPNDNNDDAEIEPLPNSADAKIKFIDEVINIAKNEPKIAEDKSGRTKYGEFFAIPKSDWDTLFILWCVNEAEIKLKTSYIGEIYPWKKKASECVFWYISRDKFRDPSIDDIKYIPQKGDLLFFDYNLNDIADHTALVTGTKENEISYILTIEGHIPGDNPDNKIREREIKFTNKYIYGYGSVL